MPDKSRVCGVGSAWGLDNVVRKWVQDPNKILKNYVREGMTALDVGCGPGFFSIEMAKLVGKTGWVIAADLQEGMLDKLAAKTRGKEIGKRISLHQCDTDRIGITEKVDFVLAFYMVHEVPDQRKFFQELYSILKPGGKMLIVEPKFHVSLEDFKNTVSIAKEAGFKPLKREKVLLSRAVVLIH